MKCWPVVAIPLFLCGNLISHIAIAQSNQADSLFYDTAIYNALQAYHSTIQDQSALLNGRVNVPYAVHFENDIPFFLGEKFIQGDLVYDGVAYEDVSLLYDQLTSTLITLMSFGRLQLINEKVDRFSISGHHFVRLEKTPPGLTSSGFYEHVYNGNIEVFKRVVKVVREEIQTGELLRYIDQKDSYYIKYGDAYHLVKNKKDMLDVLQTHKLPLQEYIKRKKLNFRKDFPNAIVQAAAYYDQLTK